MKLRFSCTVHIVVGGGGDVLKYQLDSSFLIIYLILKTTLFSKTLIL